MLSHRSMYRYRHSPLSAKQEAAFFSIYTQGPLPLLRLHAQRCGRTVTEPVDGAATAAAGRSRPWTAPYSRDIGCPVSERCEFLVQTFSFESMNGLMRGGVQTKDTLPYWIAKLF
jgi:hypothetical protein